VRKIKNLEGKMPIDLTTNIKIKNYLQGKKTSMSCPLSVQWISHPDLPQSPAKLGIMMCAGRVQKNWTRDLVHDLDYITAQHQPHTIVTLITNTELKEMGISNLEEEIERRKIESLQVSTNKWMPAVYSRFIEVLDLVMKRLKEGKTVILQCDDGIVRTGLCVAGLLVLAGKSTSDATAFVQTIHEDILQNPAHSVYLHNYQKKISQRADSEVPSQAPLEAVQNSAPPKKSAVDQPKRTGSSRSKDQKMDQTLII